jgi:hypothetical protein
VATGSGGSLGIVSDEIGEATGEVRSALEWAQVRAMAADGVSKSEIARRLGINRRTVKRLVEASEPPSYSREPAGSMLDPLEPVLRPARPGCRGLRGARMRSCRPALLPSVELSFRPLQGVVGAPAG